MVLSEKVQPKQSGRDQGTVGLDGSLKSPQLHRDILYFLAINLNTVPCCFQAPIPWLVVLGLAIIHGEAKRTLKATPPRALGPEFMSL